ncbi:MAG: lysozyme inhibitor LprI family protein [Rhizomicrobium sp.]
MIATAAALLLGAAPARADEADGLDCNNAMTQRDMNICADKDYRAADRQLNAAYVRAMEGLDGRSRELLRTAQRNWIKFRDLECAYRAEQNEGGSIYPLVYSGCLTELTLARTKQLKAGQQ